MLFRSLISYDGLRDGSKKYSLVAPSQKYDSFWNFFRERDNHFYLGGEGFESDGSCNNNLVISDQGGVSLNDVRNAFVVANSSGVTVMPIFDVNKVIELSTGLLPNGKIKYHPPQRVFRRERSPLLNQEKVRDELNQLYGIDAKEISPIISGRSEKGIYHILERDGREFVLKFRGKDGEYIRSLSEVLRDIPEYFPKIHLKSDGSASAISNIDGGLYWLEDFVEGDPLKRSHEDYTFSMGTLIAGLHKSLEEILEKDSKLRKILRSKGEYFGESTLLSVYLDLAKGEINRDFVLPYLREIISNGLSNRMRELSDSLIHGDLNNSNIILGEDSLRIIDSEIFRISPRINDFVTPLILEGNKDAPSYILGSLPQLVEAHNRISTNPLSKEEEDILPDLLIGAMLRYHVVRNIRKNIPKEDPLLELKESLQGLMEDKKRWT